MKKAILIMSFVIFPLTGFAEYRWHDYDNRHHQDYFWDKVEQRLHRQQHHIEKGIYNGELTRLEARRLQRKHERLAERIDRTRRRPNLSQFDKRRIISKLNKNSDQIGRLKHNNNNYHFDRPSEHRHFIERYDRHERYNSNNGRGTAGFYFRY